MRTAKGLENGCAGRTFEAIFGNDAVRDVVSVAQMYMLKARNSQHRTTNQWKNDKKLINRAYKLLIKDERWCRKSAQKQVSRQDK